MGRLSDEDGGLILGRKIISTIELLLPESTDALFEWFDLDRKVVRDENGNYGVREYCNTGININQYGQIVREECATKYQGQWKDVIESHYASPNDARALDALLNFIGPLLVGYSGTEDRLILSAGEPYYGVQIQIRIFFHEFDPKIKSLMTCRKFLKDYLGKMSYSMTLQKVE